jgi:pyridoxamine 5'-phosphate oxidase
MNTLDPEKQFAQWFAEALAQEGAEAARCVVATSTPDGHPSARIVYHRPGASGRLRFFTNYESRKGEELSINPNCAVVFQWPSLGRQLRLEGACHKVSAEDSDAYFNARDLESQIASSRSPQSRAIESIVRLREQVSQELAHAARVQRPAHWGGYELVPERIEFWTSGKARLHDRQLFIRHGDGWRVSQLAP